jgi:hypothetical protein
VVVRLSEDEVLAVIRRHPEAIVEALEGRPEFLAGLILKLAPWDRFATKDDIKMLIDLFNRRFEELTRYSEKRFEELKAYSDKRFEELTRSIDKRFEDMNKRFEEVNNRFEDMNRRFEDINDRFEDVNKRFEEVNNRFEDMNRRFEDINNRFEDMNKRFEDLRYYVDKRVGLVEKLLVGFNIPILTGIIIMLIRLFTG